MNDVPPLLDAEALRRLPPPATAPCSVCVALASAGWDSLSASVDRSVLERIGTLRRPDVDDPPVAEYHPAGTHAWSPDAPIAPAWFPYNRCDVWRCTACRRPFLRYTEYGGYYQDERIRVLDPALVADVPAP
jgi:hypothetical protein